MDHSTEHEQRLGDYLQLNPERQAQMRSQAVRSARTERNWVIRSLFGRLASWLAAKSRLAAGSRGGKYRPSPPAASGSSRTGG
jgi:hypothetical protein